MLKCSELSPVVRFNINTVMVILVRIQIVLLLKNVTMNYIVDEFLNDLNKVFMLFAVSKYFHLELNAWNNVVLPNLSLFGQTVHYQLYLIVF